MMLSVPLPMAVQVKLAVSLLFTVMFEGGPIISGGSPANKKLSFLLLLQVMYVLMV